MMLTLATALFGILVTTLVPTVANPTLDDQIFCGALDRVRQSAATQFENLRGPAIRDGRWQARLIVPGFDDCTITTINNSFTYLCQTDLKETLDPTKIDVRTMGARIQACLGDDINTNMADMGKTGLNLSYFPAKGPGVLVTTMMDVVILPNANPPSQLGWRVQMMISGTQTP